MWTLARLWYAGRLDPDWRRPSAADASAMFREAGLDGPFWRVEVPAAE